MTTTTTPAIDLFAILDGADAPEITPTAAVPALPAGWFFEISRRESLDAYRARLAAAGYRVTRRGILNAAGEVVGHPFEK